MLNLINQKGQFNELVHEIPDAKITISILGTQSTGKSTLLNFAFGSSFEMLDSTKERKRCTIGINMQNRLDINIFDTEGFDSEERQQNEKIFQRQMSLFCTLISDIVLINLFSREIGRYQGSHMHIIDVLFRAAMKLQKKQKKKLYFIIRDCYQHQSKELLQDYLQNQFRSIESKYQNSKIRFQIHFVFLSNYLYQPESFQEEAQNLKKLIYSNRVQTMYNYEKKDRVVYMKQLWAKIIDENTEIDLKVFDDAIKLHVLDRLKTEIYHKLAQDLQRFKDLSKFKSFNVFINDLKDTSMNFLIMNRPKHIQNRQVTRYNDQTFEQFRNKAIIFFNNQILPLIKTKLLNLFDNQINIKSKNKDFAKILKIQKQKIQKQFKKLISGYPELEFEYNTFCNELQQITKRKFTLLFERNIKVFENLLQRQIIITLNKDIHNNFNFNEKRLNDLITNLLKKLSFQKNDLQFTEIWDRVIFKIFNSDLQYTVMKASNERNQNIFQRIFDQTMTIVSFHNQLEAKITDFYNKLAKYCQNYISEEKEGTHASVYLRIKQTVHEIMYKKLEAQQRKFRLSLIFIAGIMFILHRQLNLTFKIIGFKKNKRALMLTYFTYLNFIVFALAIYIRYFKKYNHTKS